MRLQQLDPCPGCGGSALTEDGKCVQCGKKRFNVRPEPQKKPKLVFHAPIIGTLNIFGGGKKGGHHKEKEDDSKSQAKRNMIVIEIIMTLAVALGTYFFSRGATNPNEIYGVGVIIWFLVSVLFTPVIAMMLDMA